MKTQHRIVEIDPAKFAEQVPKDTETGERIFDEADVLKFLIDTMNAAKINVSMINQDHENAIEYRGKRGYFSMGIIFLDAPEGAVIEGIAEMSYILNDQGGIESWIAYKNGKHVLHILRNNEIQEAEDNIEADME